MLICGKNVLKETPVSKIHKVYLKENISKDIIRYLEENNLHYEFVPENRLNKMVNAHNQGIILDVDDYEYYDLASCLEEDFVVLLDHLEDPHNLGAIIRTCECAGIKSIIIPSTRSVRVNETVMKISAGALNNIKIIEVSNLNNAIKKLQEKYFFVYTADMDGKDYQTIDYAPKRALVIGAEGKGISRLTKELSDEVISIPMYGKINSLNASVSAAILIYGMLKR